MEQLQHSGGPGTVCIHWSQSRLLEAVSTGHHNGSQLTTPTYLAAEKVFVETNSLIDLLPGWLAC